MSFLMTSVTLKIRSRSPSSNLVFDLPWCFCVPNLVRRDQIFLQILSRNHRAYVVDLNDVCNPDNEVKVTQFKLGLCLALVLLCNIFGEDMSNTLQILSGNHLSYVVASNDLCDLENEVKVTWFEFGLRFALMLLCTKFGDDTSNIS